MADTGMLIVIAVYLFGMIAVGLWFSKKNETVGDFYLGGRKLGPVVTAMSAEASDMSSYLLMGLPGLAYLSGMAEVGWTAIGLAAGTYLNWLLVAKRLRSYTEATGSITVPSFFSNRYRDKKRYLQTLAAVWIIVFFVPYTASGFAACGKLFNTLFGIEYHVAMVMSAVVIVLYTSLGGFLAASTTDLIQSVIMTIALMAILFFAVDTAGGFGAIFNDIDSLKGYLNMTAVHNHTDNTALNYSPLSIISTLAWGLGYFGMPHILLRFMAAENNGKLRTSRRIASVWVIISMTMAVFIGVAGRALSDSSHIVLLDNTAVSETVIIEIARLLSQNGPAAIIIAGLGISGILASTMSTSDSQLLAASSSIYSDIMVDVMHKKNDDMKSLNSSRLVVLAISVIATVLAWDQNSSVFKIVSFAWAGFGASFGPAVLLALFWKRSNRQGCLAGMLTGGVTVFIWKFLVRPMGGAFDIYELLPAFLLSLVINVIISLVSPKPSEEIIKEFESL